jgi:hypothetical protein
MSDHQNAEWNHNKMTANRSFDYPDYSEPEQSSPYHIILSLQV